jgi:hypothetical protein
MGQDISCTAIGGANSLTLLPITDWRGRQSSLEQRIIDALKFDDHILADFRGDKPTDAVIFNAAYPRLAAHVPG